MFNRKYIDSIRLHFSENYVSLLECICWWWMNSGEHQLRNRYSVYLPSWYTESSLTETGFPLTLHHDHQPPIATHDHAGSAWRRRVLPSRTFDTPLTFCPTPGESVEFLTGVDGAQFERYVTLKTNRFAPEKWWDRTGRLLSFRNGPLWGDIRDFWGEASWIRELPTSRRRALQVETNLTTHSNSMIPLGIHWGF